MASAAAPAIAVATATRAARRTTRGQAAGCSFAGLRASVAPARAFPRRTQGFPKRQAAARSRRAIDAGSDAALRRLADVCPVFGRRLAAPIWTPKRTVRFIRKAVIYQTSYQLPGAGFLRRGAIKSAQ